MLYAMADNNISITTARDAALYNAFANNKDFIIGNVGNELSCGSVNLTVTLQSGEGVLQGRHITCEGTETVTVSANSSGYIALRYDLTQTLGNELSLVAVGSLTQNDLLNGGTIRDLPLYSYTANATTATLTDVRNIMSSPLDILGDQIILSMNGNDLYIDVK